MLETVFISKKLLGKFSVSQKNPLALSCEKITQIPRSYSTTQIKSATENILLTNIEENILPEIVTKSIEYLLKDLFIQMHQTGLYNRQFKLWKSLAKINSISVFRLQRGLFKKCDLNTCIVDFFIDPKHPCISVIIDENKNTSEFMLCLKKVIRTSNLNRLKGVFYFVHCIPDETFITRLKFDTNAFDPISKYESILLKTNDVRLNVIGYKEEGNKYNFKYVYPEVKSIKTEEAITIH